MEKLNFLRTGAIKLPPGFRFHPTDEELVLQYLRRKVHAYPLPASIIPDIDICKYEPWDLPGDSEQERYFFTTREAKYRNGNRPNRATASGYWKATGLDKKIVASKNNKIIVGVKKTLVFYRGKPSNASRTDWIMHEYRLAEALQRQNSTTQTQIETEDWVLCRIFLKKRSSTKNGDDEIAQRYSSKKEGVVELTLRRPSFIDFLKQDKISSNPPPPATTTSSSSSSSSSSGSSGVTEVSSSTDDNSISSSSCGRHT